MSAMPPIATKAVSRSETICGEAAYAPHLYSIAASVRAMRVGGTLSAAEISSLGGGRMLRGGKRGAVG
jgi:hypothetical protein